ncbi:exported protein of unknown function [Ralstonia solanacearum CMR15]|nr:exported protein of unknown function [Ralstonia solanacearum CMR15]
MKGLISGIAGAFLMTCTGCGGGSDGGAQQSTDSTSVTAPKATILIEAYGDSTMRGLQTADWSTVLFSPTSVTQDRLRAQYGTRADITVSNQAVNGRRAVDLVNGTDGLHLPWVQTAANSHARVVLFNYAINDATGQFPVTADDYRASLTFLITEARKDGKTPVLEEPNPICSSTAASATLDNFVAVMRDVAAAQGVPLIQQYDVIKSIPGWQAKYGSDCIHPLLEIYQGKATRQADALAALVGPML